VAADLVLAPVMPSNTARAGGVVFPILQSLARTMPEFQSAAGARCRWQCLRLRAGQAGSPAQ